MKEEFVHALPQAQVVGMMVVEFLAGEQHAATSNAYLHPAPRETADGPVGVLAQKLAAEELKQELALVLLQVVAGQVAQVHLRNLAILKRVALPLGLHVLLLAAEELNLMDAGILSLVIPSPAAPDGAI